MAFPTNYGGGKASVFADNSTFVTDKPYDVGANWNQDTADQINEMLDILFKTQRQINNAGTTFVKGPSSSTDGDVALFSGVTGGLLKDAGYKGSVLAHGPGASTTNDIVVFSGTDGITLADSGQTIASITGSVSWQKTVLTNGQILTAHSVPIQLVAAPGSGKAVVPLVWYMREDSSAGAYSANPTFNVQYVGNATALLSGITPNLNSGDKRWATGNQSGWGPLTFNPENVAVNVQSTADVTGGNAANTILIMLGYLISQ